MLVFQSPLLLKKLLVTQFQFGKVELDHDVLEDAFNLGDAFLLLDQHFVSIGLLELHDGVVEVFVFALFIGIDLSILLVLV